MRKIFLLILFPIVAYSQNDTVINYHLDIDTVNFYSSVGKLYITNPQAKYVSIGNYWLKPGEIFRVYEYNNRTWMVNSDNNKFSIVADSVITKYDIEKGYRSYEKRYGDYLREDYFKIYFWEKSVVDKIKKQYGLNTWNTILAGKVKIGWSKKLCELSWGVPEKINRTTTANNIYEQWVYAGGYLYFSNGILKTIQN